jgi:hypothetical protein
MYIYNEICLTILKVQPFSVGIYKVKFQNTECSILFLDPIIEQCRQISFTVKFAKQNSSLNFFFS